VILDRAQAAVVATAAIVTACASRTAHPGAAARVRVVAAPVDPAPAPQRRRKVLVIGVDGVRLDVLSRLDHPALSRLQARGILRQTWTDVLPVAHTDSGPGWATIATGVSPDKHRVRGNDFTGHALADYPDFLTRLERVAPALHTYAIASWPPLTGWLATGAIFSDAIDVRVLRDGDRFGWAAADVQITQDAASYLQSRDPDAAFVYLGNPDDVAHHRGVGDDYRSAIVAVDAQIGRLLDAVEARPGYAGEDWLIVVTTDHGQLDEGGHGGASWQERQSFVVAAGGAIPRDPSPIQPRNVDIAATVFDHLRIPVDAAWKLDGVPLRAR